MKIEIEDYKNHTIYYDDDKDKFVVDMDIDGHVKNAKRGSLVDLRKEIDLFIKENLNFKPFKVLWNRWSSVEEKDIIGIRVDKKLIMGTKDRFDLIGSKEADNVYVYDKTIVEDLNEAEEEYRLANKKYNQSIENIKGRLLKMDLTKYDLK